MKAAELQGMRPAAVMAKEILPSLSTPLMVEAGLRLTYSIIIMSGLAFLGLRPAAARRQLGNDDQREPDRPAAEPVGGDRPGRA